MAKQFLTQIGINAVPVASALLQVDSITQGFLMPRMTNAERIAIAAPAEGLQVYDTTLSSRCVFSGGTWQYQYEKNTTAIQTSTSNAYANITELVTPSLDVGLYALELKGIMQSTNVNTGVGLKLINGSSTISTIVIEWQFNQAGAGTAKNFAYSQTATADNITSASAVTANANFSVLGAGVFRVTTAGTVIIQLRSENNGIGISIRPDSSLIIKKVG